ncbi:MAG: hypothetical protein V4620_14120 [Bacteroidota bacterium]
MKYCISIILFLVLSATHAQNKFHGEYGGYGTKLILDSNGTFVCNTHYRCIGYDFVAGIWTQQKDTVYFIKTLVLDTVRFEFENQNSMDSLVVSKDEKADRISKEEYEKGFHMSGWQDTSINIGKLFYRKDRLYKIKPNGKLITKKRKVYGPPKGSLRLRLYMITHQQRYNPWYTKVVN